MADKSPLIIGIGGASGSGKTTLAKEVAQHIKGLHFPIDNYYFDLSHLPYAERARQNFDHPDAIEVELMAAHLVSLRRGVSVPVPRYDFAEHTRIGSAIASPTALVIEGNLALHFKQLREHYDICIFVAATDAVCYQRRLLRDTAERGRSEDSVREQYERTVRPMFLQFVRPSARYADFVIDGSLVPGPMAQLVNGLIKEAVDRQSRS